MYVDVFVVSLFQYERSLLRWSFSLSLAVEILGTIVPENESGHAVLASQRLWKFAQFGSYSAASRYI
jgi:hypothetical protein